MKLTTGMKMIKVSMIAQNSKLLFAILFIFNGMYLIAQNNMSAKDYFVKARSAFDQGNFELALENIEASKLLLNSTNPDILYIEAKSIIESKLEYLDVDVLLQSFLDSADASDSRISEVSTLLSKIKQLKKNNNISIQPSESVESLSDVLKCQDILEKYMQAMGGRSAMEKIKTIKIVQYTESQGYMITSTFKKNNKDLSAEISVDGNIIYKSKYFNNEGYEYLEGKKKKIKKSKLENSAFEAKIFSVLQNDNSKFKYLGEQAIDGKDTYAISLSEDEKVIYYFDKNTGLIIAGKARTKFNGQKDVIRYSYESFKNFNGIMFATQISSSQDSNQNPPIVSTIESIEFNQIMTEKDFN